MKKVSFLFIIGLLLSTCNTPNKIVQPPQPAKAQEIEILCLATNCSDKEPLSLFKFNGIGFTKIQELKQVGKDSFLLITDASDPHFLYIGTESQAKLPVVLSNENMVIKGSCKAFRQSEILNSTYNTVYNDVLKTVRTNKRSMQAKLGSYRSTAKSPDRQLEIKKELALMDQQQMAYLDTLKKQHPFLANVAALGTMSSYPNKMDQYSNEVEFFAAEYFKNVDLTNPVLNNIPYLFEGFKEYSQTLASVNLPQEVMNDLIDQNLKLVPDSSQAMRSALGGTLIGLQAKNHPSFATYAKQFITKFGADTDQNALARLKGQLDQAKSFIPGGEAPEIEMNTLAGDPMKLSDLRGKVVLIDFWASWCGPCRKENPNVVRVYDKYKAAGFEILGVSLDKTKKKWEAAIKKDGLTWFHVSDLKGWQNEAAATYGVRSIPHTVLVDKEGKIIARNLRGPALERKLADIFGN